MGNLQGGEIDWTDLVYTDAEDDIGKHELRPLARIIHWDRDIVVVAVA